MKNTPMYSAQIKIIFSVQNPSCTILEQPNRGLIEIKIIKWNQNSVNDILSTALTPKQDEGVLLPTIVY